MAFVPHEGVLAVELVPGVVDARSGQRGADGVAAFLGNVRILPAPDHGDLALDLRDAVQGIVPLALAQAALVDVSGIEADRRLDLRVHGAAEAQVPAQADADGAQ